MCNISANGILLSPYQTGNHFHEQLVEMKIYTTLPEDYMPFENANPLNFHF